MGYVYIIETGEVFNYAKDGERFSLCMVLTRGEDYI